MERRLFNTLVNLLCALSLLLCMAAVVLAARTIGRLELANCCGPHHNCSYYAWSAQMGLTGTVGDGIPAHAQPHWTHRWDVNSGYGACPECGTVARR